MPSLLEGDQSLTFEFASFNVDRLSDAVDAGCDIVCSCPTCGYMLKHVLSEGACHSAVNLAEARGLPRRLNVVSGILRDDAADLRPDLSPERERA
ncbi:MAG: hypothetical protein HGB17_14195 [Syntrophobacteraceae bacterium]|nr:hypothetical protein [Syntrophobacteraceae bacterium]